MPARYRTLDHIGFAVSDLDASVGFYTLLLGDAPMLRKVWDVEYVGRIVGYPDTKLDCAFWELPGGGVLELIQYLNPPMARVDMETFNVGNAHLCLVTDDIHADFERLAGAVEFRHPTPIQIPWGPYSGGWAVYVRDPDGISIELLQEPPGGVPTLQEAQP